MHIVKEKNKYFTIKGVVMLSYHNYNQGYRVKFSQSSWMFYHANNKILCFFCVGIFLMLTRVLISRVIGKHGNTRISTYFTIQKLKSWHLWIEQACGKYVPVFHLSSSTHDYSSSFCWTFFVIILRTKHVFVCFHLMRIDWLSVLCS